MPGAVVHDIDHRVVAVAVVAGVGGNLVALVEGARVDTAPAVDDLAVERAAPPSFRQSIARGAGALVALHGGAGEVVAFLGGQRRHHARSALAGALAKVVDDYEVPAVDDVTCANVPTLTDGVNW